MPPDRKRYHLSRRLSNTLSPLPFSIRIHRNQAISIRIKRGLTVLLFRLLRMPRLLRKHLRWPINLQCLKLLWKKSPPRRKEFTTWKGRSYPNPAS